MNLGEKLVDLLRESVIFQGTITIIVLGVWAYLEISGRAVPQDVQLITGAVVGFFFGGKYTQSMARAAKKDC